jgi:MFS family permease
MARVESSRRNTFGALRHRDYRRFALSLLWTAVGAQLVLTGSALQLGLTGLARALPHMVLSLVGGVIADRADRVRMIQAGQILNGLLILGLAVVTMTGHVEVWHLYLVTFLNSAFTAITQPARTAIIPMLIPTDQLVSGVALNATIMQTSQIAGPALYLVAMLSILGIRTRTTPTTSVEGPWRSFTVGLDFVRRKPVILSLLALDLGATVFGSYRALLPISAERLGTGVAGYGWLGAAPRVGSLVGAVCMMSLGNMRDKGRYTVAGVFGYCIALAILPLSPWYWLALVASVLLGAMNSVQMVPRNTTILAISPNALRGRVEAFRSMLAGGGPQIGFMLSGTLATAFGPVGGAAACAALVVYIGATRRDLHDPSWE